MHLNLQSVIDPNNVNHYGCLLSVTAYVMKLIKYIKRKFAKKIVREEIVSTKELR